MAVTERAAAAGPGTAHASGTLRCRRGRGGRLRLSECCSRPAQVASGGHGARLASSVRQRVSHRVERAFSAAVAALSLHVGTLTA